MDEDKVYLWRCRSDCHQISLVCVFPHFGQATNQYSEIDQLRVIIKDASSHTPFLTKEIKILVRKVSAINVCMEIFSDIMSTFYTLCVHKGLQTTSLSPEK